MTTTLARAEGTMRAVVKDGPGAEGVRVRSVAVPATPPGFAKVEVLAAGVCGTDVHIADDEYACEPPVVMGHEVSGRVVHVGSDEDRDWLGAQVACETYFSTCTRCDWCRAGRVNLCPQRRSIGSFEDGAFAQFLVVPVQNLHRLPDGIGAVVGVLAEPLACLAQALLDPAVISAGDRVLVTGPGAIGQLAAQVAAACGGQVLLAGLAGDRERLQIAADIGVATTVLSPDDGGLPAESADGGFDVVIECSGTAGGAATALGAARRGGRYVQMGIFGRAVTVPLDAVLYKELVFTSGFASTPASWRRAMALLATAELRLAPLIGKPVGLEDFPSALEAVRTSTGLKSVVVPG